MNGADRLALLEHYAEQGLTLLRLNGKKPCDEQGRCLLAWETAAHAPAEIDPRWNVGVRLGAASRGWLDVDLDCPEALGLAPLFLDKFPRAMTFGRKSTPRAHWIYRCDEPRRTEQIRDVPKPGEKDGETLLELRGTGGQTMFPPSIRLADKKVAQDEEVEWTADPDEPDHPPTISWADLSEAVRALGAACLVARHAGIDAAREFAEAGTLPALPAMVRYRVAELLGCVPEAPIKTSSHAASVRADGGSNWIETLNVAGIAPLAEKLGLEPGRNRSWEPCPACEATKRGSKERRGAIGVSKDGIRWKCHACKTFGNALGLAAWKLLETGTPGKGDRKAWGKLYTSLQEKGAL